MINLTLKEKIQTPRLALHVLRPTFDNAQMHYEMIERNRKRLEEFLPWMIFEQSPENSLNFLTDSWKRFEQQQGAEYGLFEKETGDFCGMCGVVVHQNISSEYVSIGYWLDVSKCGKGYMIETVKAVEDDLFKQGLNRLVISNDTANIPSINVTKKTGYTLEGVARKAHYSHYFKEYRDKNTWAKTFEDWKK